MGESRIMKTLGNLARQSSTKTGQITRSMTDSVVDAADSAVVSVVNKGKTLSSAMTGITFAGLTMTAIANPVSFLIGLSILRLIEKSVEHQNQQRFSGFDQRRREREITRIVAYLESSGRVPSKSIITTETIGMDLDASTGIVDGIVFNGIYASRKLSSLTIEQLDNLVSTACNEGAQLLESYRKIRLSLEKK